MKNYLLKEYVSLTEEMADELIDNKIVMNSSDVNRFIPDRTIMMRLTLHF